MFLSFSVLFFLKSVNVARALPEFWIKATVYHRGWQHWEAGL